jgi:hypothetical protein
MGEKRDKYVVLFEKVLLLHLTTAEISRTMEPAPHPFIKCAGSFIYKNPEPPSIVLFDDDQPLAVLLFGNVLVGLVVLVLDEIIEQTRPRLVVVVTAEIVADRLREVEEHVPRVPGDAAHRLVTLEEGEPPPQDRRLPYREDQPPQHHRHVGGEDALARRRVQSEPEGEPVQVLEQLDVLVDLGDDLGEAALDGLDGVGADALQARHELRPGEAAHLFGVQFPRQDQDAEVVGGDLQVAAQLLDALGEDGVLAGVLVLVEEGVEFDVGGLAVGEAHRRSGLRMGFPGVEARDRGLGESRQVVAVAQNRLGGGRRSWHVTRSRIQLGFGHFCKHSTSSLTFFITILFLIQIAKKSNQKKIFSSALVYYFWHTCSFFSEN